MKRSGSADLPLHNGQVPPWLSQRMAKLGLAIVETMVSEFSTAEVLRRMSDPFWFQSLGAVMGMDWHSSGITTSVLGALKKSVNPHSQQLGLYICGGKGKHSANTPKELLLVGDKTGLDGLKLGSQSKLAAKVDNTAVQDGFQLYLHSFLVANSGEWAVIQQGMNPTTHTARRYHWHSEGLQSFVEEPHSAIVGKNVGEILDLTARNAAGSRNKSLAISREHPDKTLRELRHLIMPMHHELRNADVNLKRLGAMLWVTHEKQPKDFEELLSLQGMGPRTMQSLALVSEVIYGTPTRFEDPARFSFAHGGKDGHPFPVPTKVYDETISVLNRAVTQSKLGNLDKLEAFKALSKVAERAENNFTPNSNLQQLIEVERENSWKYSGRSIFGPAKPLENNDKSGQLSLF